VESQRKWIIYLKEKKSRVQNARLKLGHFQWLCSPLVTSHSIGSNLSCTKATEREKGSSER